MPRSLACRHLIAGAWVGFIKIEQEENKEIYWVWPCFRAAKCAKRECEQGSRLTGETGQTGVMRECCQPSVVDFMYHRGKVPGPTKTREFVLKTVKLIVYKFTNL